MNQTPETDQPIRLLLVDDETGFVEVMRKRLSRRGIDTTTATSGAEAVRVMRDQRFDAALVDLKMEDMDGIELLKILRLMSPNMPVFMLTGHGSEQAAREGMTLGATDYLTKPCDLDELIERLRRAIETRRTACAR